MPNLNQTYNLKREFFRLNNNDREVLDYLEKTEAKEALFKAFDLNSLNETINETRIFSFISENFNPLKPELIRHFDEGIEEDVALLFIDITSFSKTIKRWSNEKIKQYLDEYYNDIIPLIYKNGGEIEKLMGDGIISVFGKPFINFPNPEYVYKAENCAEQAIRKFHNTDKNIKVAIHQGTVHYYKVPGENYGEYTMIGQPITDLYRLESVSKSNAINFYSNSLYDNLGWVYSIFDETTVSCRGFKVGLQGVDFTDVKYMRFHDLK